MDSKEPEKDEFLFKQIHKFGWDTGAIFAVFGSIALIFLLFYLRQLKEGMEVTGLNVPVYWGIYIASFVYFIGLSHAGTLISAILRVTGAEWRRPLTRLAESITVFVLLFGIMNLGIDLGRPIRGALYIAQYGRYQSPLLWDFSSIMTYLILSGIFLYVAMIPDLAHVRDRVKKGKWFYEIFALNFRGTKKQWHQYEKAVLTLSIVVIPVAVSVHTVISFVFAMTVQPLWHETMFGPFFVAGAIFSGVAAINVAMYILRKFYHLEEYLNERIFNNMGKLLLAMSMIWFYFFLAENLTTYYGNEIPHMTVLRERVGGRYQLHWLTMAFTNFVIPFTILALRRTIKGVTIASASVVIGMYLERFLIVVPTLLNPRLPLVEPREFGGMAISNYTPLAVEILSILASFSIFIMLYYLFTKLVPIIPVSEVWLEDEKAFEPGNEKGTEDLYSPPDQGEGNGLIRKLQIGFIAAFLLFDFGIILFFLNGIRNGIIFGILNKEILDMGSLYFALAMNFLFLPVHITLIYTVGKLSLVLIREGDNMVSVEKKGKKKEK
ncbi:MAG: NrfD/PsrC family molybdoenzyme membrane anchor subunit [Candidatus Hydrothermarchaeales archaeon]